MGIKNLKKIYKHDIIMQFKISYLIVLILPLLICFTGFKLYFQAAEEEVIHGRMNALSYSTNVIDCNMKQIHTAALQIAKSETVQDLAEEEISTDINASNTEDAISKINNILEYLAVDLLENVVIYFDEENYYLVNGTLFCDKASAQDTYKDMKGLLEGEDDSKAHYQLNDNTLQWIQPIMGSDGHSLMGAVICNFNMDYINHLFLEDDNETMSLLMQQQDGSISYQTNQNETETDFSSILIEGLQGYIKLGNDIIIYSVSGENTWRYLLIFNRTELMKSFNFIKISQYFILLLALAIGIILAHYMSIRYGKPVNKIFDNYIPNAERNTSKLEEMFNSIVSDNQHYLNESKNEKPLLQYAFLYKLLRGEFANEKELFVLASKVGYHVSSKLYRVLAFRFENKDINEAENETLKKNQMAFCYLQAKLREFIKEEVWFYEVDHLIHLVILPCMGRESKPDEIISYIQEGILREYKINPLWGVSNHCVQVMELWRACEEAIAALEFACENKQLVFYKDIAREQSSFYYPEQFEERLIYCTQSGDLHQIKELLDLSLKENFETRNLTRSQFLKLNNQFISTLIKIDKSDLVSQHTEQLNAFAIHYYELEIQDYYALLLQAFGVIGDSSQTNKGDRGSKLNERLKDYVDTHYMDSNLGLAMLSIEFHISEGYVSTLFKEQTGTNFADYVEKLRIERSCNLLKESRLTIVKIAEEVGYNSIQSFRRAFKKVKGVSPSKLREANDRERKKGKD